MASKTFYSRTIRLELEIMGEARAVLGIQTVLAHSRGAMVLMGQEIAQRIHRKAISGMRYYRNSITNTGRMRANLTPVVKSKTKRIKHQFPTKGKALIKLWEDSTFNEILVGIGEQTPLRYTGVQELGSKNMPWIPPREPIIQWARDVGLNPDEIVLNQPKKGSYIEMLRQGMFGSEMERRPVTRGDFVWASIARKGIPKKPFMSNAVLMAFRDFARKGLPIWYGEMRKTLFKATRVAKKGGWDKTKSG